MKFEHFGINVKDARGMAEWYIRNLGMKAVRSMDKAPFTHFLADESGRVAMEIYTNPAAEIPDYGKLQPLRFHVAFAVPDTAAVKNKLVAAGATFLEGQRLDDGTDILMLRDPWGLAIQLCRRSTPMV